MEEKYLGYEVTDEEINLTNERLFTEKGVTEEDILKMYEDYKDCELYAKAIKLLNNLYSNELLLDSYQSILNDTVSFKFDVRLVMYDTYLLSDKLTKNEKLLATKKKTKLLTERIEPKTEFLEKANIIELAMKHYKDLDNKTQKQVLALVMQSVHDSDIIDNIKYL